jgi:hypothetical protein
MAGQRRIGALEGLHFRLFSAANVLDGSSPAPDALV